MRSEMSDDEPSTRAEPMFETSTARRTVIQGVIVCGLGILIGMIALVLCCYSLGLDFRSEGWGDKAANSSDSRQHWLVFSLVGFGLAIPLFWVGFFRITHPDSRTSRQKSNTSGQLLERS